jgi:hypothetical protein
LRQRKRRSRLRRARASSRSAAGRQGDVLPERPAAHLFGQAAGLKRLVLEEAAGGYELRAEDRVGPRVKLAVGAGLRSQDRKPAGMAHLPDRA